MKRQRRAVSEWEEILEQWRASGLAGREFAEAHDLKVSSLYRWSRRLEAGKRQRRGGAQLTAAPNRGEICTRLGRVCGRRGRRGCAVAGAARGVAMLTFPSGVRLYLATAPTDMRKSFDALSTLVQSEFGLSPLQGDLFIFLNRRGTQVRILFWDRDGYCLLCKRLEQGTFRRVRTPSDGVRVEIDAGELAMLLEGIDAKQVRRRKRYKPPAPVENPAPEVF
jgi:transposase